MAGNALEETGSTLRGSSTAPLDLNASPSTTPIITHAWLWERMRKHSSTPFASASRRSPAPVSQAAELRDELRTQVSATGATSSVELAQPQSGKSFKLPSTADSTSQPKRKRLEGPSFHLSSLLSGSRSVTSHEVAKGSSAIQHSTDTSSTKRQHYATAPSVIDFRPPAPHFRPLVPEGAHAPELQQHVRNWKDSRGKLHSTDGGTLTSSRESVVTTKAKATGAGIAVDRPPRPKILSERQLALRNSRFAMAEDQADIDSPGAERFWKAIDRIRRRERSARDMSPEEKDAYAARLEGRTPKARPRLEKVRRPWEVQTASDRALDATRYPKPEWLKEALLHGSGSSST